VTLAEELAFIRGLERSLGRPIGVYPEIKDPAWHRGEGIELGDRVIAALSAAGYAEPDSRAYLQCFEPAELTRLRLGTGCRLPLIQLLDSAGGLPDAAALAHIASYAAGIGPSLQLVCRGGNGAGLQLTGLIAAAHAAGLVVHPYTVRRETLPAGIERMEQLLDLVLGQGGADGLFTDFPDVVANWLRER
jgi:glycerophosphoryl diester phosphodiesterase